MGKRNSGVLLNSRITIDNLNIFIINNVKMREMYVSILI